MVKSFLNIGVWNLPSFDSNFRGEMQQLKVHRFFFFNLEIQNLNVISITETGLGNLENPNKYFLEQVAFSDKQV